MEQFNTLMNEVLKLLPRRDFRAITDYYGGDRYTRYFLIPGSSFSPQKKFRFKNPLYALDASVISLCLNIFPWAKFRTGKGAIKLHCLYDQDYGIPSFLAISDGKIDFPFLKVN